MSTKGTSIEEKVLDLCLLEISIAKVEESIAFQWRVIGSISDEAHSQIHKEVSRKCDDICRIVKTIQPQLIHDHNLVFNMLYSSDIEKLDESLGEDLLGKIEEASERGNYYVVDELYKAGFSTRETLSLDAEYSCSYFYGTKEALEEVKDFILGHEVMKHFIKNLKINKRHTSVWSLHDVVNFGNGTWDSSLKYLKERKFNVESLKPGLLQKYGVTL